MTTTSGVGVGVAHSRQRRIGSSSLAVFPMAISGSIFGWTADVATTTAILDTYRELGGNFIDTADSYAGGRSEIMIGNSIVPIVMTWLWQPRSERVPTTPGLPRVP
jgi:hypothetical protein